MVESKITTLRKITVKEVMGVTATGKDVTAAYLKLSDEVDGKPLMKVAGDVTAYGSKVTAMNESIFLLGMFLAQNMVTGKMFRSTKAYLPRDATENLVSTFTSQKDNDRHPVSFIYNISVQEHAKTGHTIISEPEQTIETVNREAEMMQIFKALPPPKKRG